MLLLEKLNLITATDSEWTHLYNLHKIINAKYGFLNFARDKKDFVESKKKEYPPDGDNEIIFLLKGENAVGLIQKWNDFDWGGNPEVKISCHTIPDELNEECYSLLKEYLAATLDKCGKVTLLSHNNELTPLFSELKAKVQIKEVFWSIKKEELNQQMLENWVEEVSAKNPELTLKFFNTVPDELLEQYSELFMETELDMPETKEEAYVHVNITPETQKMRNENFKNSNIIHNWCGIFNEQNYLIGMSNVRHNALDTRFIYQFMISTNRNYRGRKLGRWMYAALYLKILAEVPNFELIYLFHHPENTPAFSLSKRTGYTKGYSEDFIVLEK